MVTLNAMSAGRVAAKKAGAERRMRGIRMRRRIVGSLAKEVLLTLRIVGAEETHGQAIEAVCA